MIKIKSFFEKDLLDEVDYTGNLGEYFDSIDEHWRKRSSQPVEVYLNGNHLSPVDFDNVNVSSLCNVEIYILPKGGLLKPIGKLFGGILNFAFGWLMPSSRSSHRSRVNTPQGDKLELSSIKSNNPRLGSVVPECFGRYRRYFDSLNQPRRYFINRRQQEVSGVLCVGVGEYDSEPLHIGDTPFSDMENSSYSWFNPNDDLEGYYENWHTVSEVGATSSGTAGLELSMEVVSGEDIGDDHPDGGYIFNGNTITRADGTPFNIDLSTSDEVMISLPMEYQHTTMNYVISGRSYTATSVDGFLHHARVDGKIPKYSSFTEVIDDNGSRWYKYKPPLPGYPGTASYTGVVLQPKSGLTISVWGEDKKWKITDISGDTITVSDGEGGYFPENFASENAELKYEISPTINRGFLTNKYTATPAGVFTREIEIDFFFPQGLCYIGDNGGLYSENVSIEVTVIDEDSASFGTVYRFDYTDNTNDQIGVTERITLPYEMTPSVYMRRIGSINNSVQSHSQVTWFGLKSRLPDVTRYPKWTTVGFTMQTGGKISSQSENLVNSIVTRKLPILQDDGSWSSDNRATRDIASFVRYISHAIGYTDNDIDMDELKRLHNQFWKPRNEYFDYIFDETTVKQAIDLGLNAGLSDLTISNGKIKPVRDDIRTVYEQVYSAQNVTSDITYTFKTKEDRAFDGVEVEFVEYPSFENKTIICALPDSEKIKLRKVQIKGVTDINKAYVIGMRLASEDRYVNREFSFKTEMDAFNSEYMSYISVVIDDPKYSQSCKILQVNDDHLVLSEKIRNNPDTFAFRDERGKLIGPYDIISISENNVYVNLDVKPKVSLNRELPHAFLGTKERWSYPCLIDDITPSGTNSATVKASIYDSRVYAYDDEVYQ